jgi:hypothetical protein
MQIQIATYKHKKMDRLSKLKSKTLALVMLVSLCLCQLLYGQSTKPFCKLFDYNINMLICYGQSLSVGEGATNEYSNFRNIISFKGGCNEWSSKVNINDSVSVANYYGDDFVRLESIAKKSWPPVAAIAVVWMNLLEKENGIDLAKFDNEFLLSTPGYSGISIEKLSVGTEYYKRLLLGVKKACEFSKKENKTFGVPCLFWVQGEANVKTDTEEQYYKKLQKIFADLNTDIKSITKQEKDVIFITYQTAPVIGTIPYPSVEKPTVYEDCGPSFAQLKLAGEKNNVYMGGAMYQYDYGDIWHPKDRATVGVQLGIAAKRIISDNSPLSLFSPIKHTIKNKDSKWILSVKFRVPVPPMRFDASGDKFHNLRGKQTNYGFILKNGKGKDIISKEPFIKNGNTLVFECIENPANAKLSYALNGHYGGGNLCDSQNISINNKGADYVIDNFCPTFRDYILR